MEIGTAVAMIVARGAVFGWAAFRDATRRRAGEDEGLAARP